MPAKFVFSLLTILLCFHCAPAICADNNLHIAVVGPLTGQGKANGQSLLKGITLYVDAINAADGINGKKLVLDIYDDQNDSQKCTEKALEVIKDNRALAVLGHNYSSCSTLAGVIYKQHKIPAISATSTDDNVTKDNDWYFRVIFNSNRLGQFLPNYIKNVLKQDTVSIIQEDLPYGSYLAQVFKEETTKGLGINIAYTGTLPTQAKNQDEIIRNIISDLKALPKSGTIVLLVHAPEGIKLVKAIKDAGLKNTMIGPNSLTSKVFKDGFKNFVEEKTSPGHYTNGVMVTTPLIFDSAPEIVQKFKQDYAKKFGEKPNWRSAFAYDSALIVAKAIKRSGIQGNISTLQEDRIKLRNYLASINNAGDAIEGITGTNYFDKHGDALKSISVGTYRRGNIISALTQLQNIRDLHEIPNFNDAVKNERVLYINGHYMYKTSVVYTGMEVMELSDLNMESLTFTTDFYLWFRYQGDFNPENIEFINAATTIELGEPLRKEIHNGIEYKLYRIKGSFKADFGGQASFQSHTLSVTFRHQVLNQKNLIFVTDVLGMGIASWQSNETSIKDTASLINPYSGWKIAQSWFFQNTIAVNSLGKPAYIDTQGRTIDFSQFNAGFALKKNDFTLRGTIPKDFVIWVGLFSILAVFALIALDDCSLFNRYAVIIFFGQILGSVFLLITSEIILFDWVSYQLGHANTQLAIQAFDILWWLMPAIFANIATERFLWAPLELKTGRTVPKLVRRFVALIVYTLAFLGIVAYVFNQQLTSLLATSGVLAMIIGLAVQTNIANIFSGIVVNIDRPFRIGDWIKVGDLKEGEVIDITWRTIRIKTRTACILCVPNSVAAESSIINFSYPNDLYYNWCIVHIHPRYSPDRVKKILRDAACSVANDVETEPMPWIVLAEITKWSASYWVIYACRNYARFYLVREAVWQRCWHHLKRANIDLAVRQDLLLYKGEKQLQNAQQQPHTLILDNLALFQDFPQEAKTHLQTNMQPHHVVMGEKLLQTTLHNQSLLVVAEGVIAVSINATTTESTELKRLGVSGVLGELNSPSDTTTFTVTAITESTLLEIPIDDFHTISKGHPKIQQIVADIIQGSVITPNTTN